MPLQRAELQALAGMATRLHSTADLKGWEKLCIHTEKGEHFSDSIKQSSNSDWKGWFDPLIC